MHTDSEGYLFGQHFWDLLIVRIGPEFEKRMRDIPHQADEITMIIEFSWVREQGGYRNAFSYLTSQLLEKAAILYLDVFWEESLRKNCSRFKPEIPDSILEHALSD